LYCLQRISCATKLCCLKRNSFRCWIVVSQWISLLTILCFSESVRWWVYVVTNQFVDESVLQRISLLTSCVAANQFTDESVFWQINFVDESVSLVLLTNLYSSKSVHWWVCITANQFADKSVFHQISFADESMSPIFIDKWYVTSESVFLTNCMSQANQFRCWILHNQWSSFAVDFLRHSHVKNDVNAYNNLIVWLCNMWNTWMWTCVFLENVWWRVMWLSNTNVLIVIIFFLSNV
jgi:hypothetical protein